ncbi:MAG: valine--tRNA ligase [Deltaproteobacteria bacterium]|nr:valine--tRNA ligase [Deltaproteobacteria bacterium]MBW2360555.1 valine--tRNA ligase [Deltaproteobacteria bacterium]
MASVRSIDVAALPKHFDAAAAEVRWDAAWEKSGVYRWDPSRPRQETFVVDTPPPTASGELHVGHVFSYTHTDVVVRFQRMRGKNIFYPIGWDDNGVPTERRVQNLFHVRCDPTLPRDPALELEPATAKLRKGRHRVISRPDFIDLCARVTAEDEKAFLEMWRRVGLSVDWTTEYATIDARCRQLAQYSFWDLFQKSHVYQNDAPFMWDVDYQMAVAQAEVEDRELRGAYHDIEFAVEGEDRGFVISTTRPELLAACVGVTAHPEDERYKPLFGKRAITPLFRVPVPIFPSDKADPEKGTGVLMVCTFGDQTDIEWWRSEGLALRQLVGRNGRLVPVTFGEEGFESLDAAAANDYYAELTGLPVPKARKKIVELLADPAGSATGGGAPLQREPRPIEHAVKFYERGDSPLEFLPTRQWFVRLLDKKQELLAKGEAIQWHPAHMQNRYRDWTENLGLDWCISRQRYFGVPIPVWYRLDDSGERDYANPIVASPERLPVDPMTDTPEGFDAAQRGKPGGFEGESDIFDTWFTSSLTPQIGSGWPLDASRHAQLFPADVRPQSHEIIRTWAFYTIAKSMLHEDSVPWRNVLISGWILDPDRKKMSKSKGNVVTPLHLLEQHTSDGVRYWAASARLGVDTAFDEKVFKVGKRLVTKLFNASKFVLAQTADAGAISQEIDRAFIAELRALVERATADFERYEFGKVLQETESFFWQRFTDTGIELLKHRARDESDAAGRASAVATLRLGLSVLLRLFAPVLPYITEEVWSWAFADETGSPSIHAAAWPDERDFAGVAAPADAASLDVAVEGWRAVMKAKSEAAVSMGREIESLTLAANPATLARLAPGLADVLSAVRCKAHSLLEDEALEDGAFEARDTVFSDA